MRIEKLTENKIRIILNMQDLQEKNIDLHSFMSNSIESQDLFYDMLDKAEKEIGFQTKDYKLMIEALAAPEGNFILTVTRIVPEKDPKKKLKVKRKTPNIPTNLSVYKFDTFDEYLEFCISLMNDNKISTYTFLKKSTLYLYKSNYYLCLYVNEKDISSFKSVHYSIIEFASHVNNSSLFERKLKEYGKVIFKANAIQTCVKHFE